jgi:hypothetical protein
MDHRVGRNDNNIWDPQYCGWAIREDVQKSSKAFWDCRLLGMDCLAECTARARGCERPYNERITNRIRRQLTRKGAVYLLSMSLSLSTDRGLHSIAQTRVHLPFPNWSVKLQTSAALSATQ